MRYLKHVETNEVIPVGSDDEPRFYAILSETTEDGRQAYVQTGLHDPAVSPDGSESAAASELLADVFEALEDIGKSFEEIRERLDASDERIDALEQAMRASAKAEPKAKPAKASSKPAEPSSEAEAGKPAAAPES